MSLSLQLVLLPVLSSSEQGQLKASLPFILPPSRASLSTGATISYMKHLVSNGLFVLEGTGPFEQQAVILGSKGLPCAS